MIDYLITNMWLLWLIISLVCLIIELSSGDLYLLCFSIGALIAMGAEVCGAPMWLQVLVLAIASVLCLLFVRPKLIKRLHNKEERKSNADALIGRTGKVITDIPAGGHFGYVKISGDEWRCVSESGEAIPVDTIVTVVKQESIVLTVK